MEARVNAMEILDQVRAAGGRMALDGGRLVVTAPAPLPDDLQAAVREHKTELLVALGVPFNGAVASILTDLRPHLNKSLRDLPDGKLLALVNLNIMAAWGKALREVQE